MRATSIRLDHLRAGAWHKSVGQSDATITSYVTHAKAIRIPYGCATDSGRTNAVLVHGTHVRQMAC